MKIYISADMEGSTGVVATDQVTAGSSRYSFGCRMQAADVTAAVRGALDGGADSVILNDSHSSMVNLDISAFGKAVSLITGTPKLLGMTEGVSGCDGAFFTGYHAMAGTEKAVFDHTFDPYTIYSLSINGQRMGETGVNALFCGALKVPVALVTGDEALCLEASSLLGPELETACVKEGLGRQAALCLTPEASSEVIYKAAKAAAVKLAAGEVKLFTLKPPFNMEVSLMNTLQTDAASLVPGAMRIAARTISFEAEEPLELRRMLYSVMETAAMQLQNF